MSSTDLPAAIIVDLDGTLALRDAGEGSRRWNEFMRVGEDAVNQPIVDLINMLADGLACAVIAMSGRPDEGSCRRQTELWLDAADVCWDELFMRREGDYRADNVVKRELYEAHVAPRYRVLYCIDDRKSVVDEWRRLGLVCLDVAGNTF